MDKQAKPNIIFRYKHENKRRAIVYRVFITKISDKLFGKIIVIDRFGRRNKESNMIRKDELEKYLLEMFSKRLVSEAELMKLEENHNLDLTSKIPRPDDVI